MTDGRPSAWQLPRGHPDLCPGSGQPCLHDPCYRNTTCTTCGARTSAEPVHTTPGGGRVADHYPLDPPRPWAPPARCRIDAYGRGLAPGQPPGPPPSAELVGQLNLALEEPDRG